MQKKRILSLFIVLALSLSMWPMSALAVSKGALSGSCGENLTWTISEDGTMTITGFGEMYDSAWPAEELYTWETCANYAKALVITEGVTTIGDYAFSTYFSNLTSVSLPSTIKEIGYSAFSDCTKLAGIEIPEGVTAIGDGAFFNCSSLETINIPASVSDIQISATPVTFGPFGQCLNLKNIYVADDNTNYCDINGVLFSRDLSMLLAYPAGRSDNIYTIPDGVKSITNNAFNGSRYLQSVQFPEGLSYVGMFSFHDCNGLLNAIIPNTVESIGICAFKYCGRLKDLHFCGDAPGFVGPAAFPEDIIIYYREGSTGWTTPTWNGYQTALWEDEPSGSTARILQLHPENGSTNAGYDSSNPFSLNIVFDRNVQTGEGNRVQLDFSAGKSISVYRVSDDALIWRASESQFTPGTCTDIAVDLNKAILNITPSNAHTLLESGVEYYVTLDAGFIKFEDGSTNPAIAKKEWTFRTGVTEKTGTFEFLAGDGSVDRSYQYEYEDSYFADSSFEYDHDLAKMSLNLALAAGNSYRVNGYGGYDRNNAGRNIRNLLDDIGFENIDINSYEGKPTPDTIAAAIGMKTVEQNGTPYTLIAVAIRGSGYELEWANNFEVFSEDEHRGFSIAASGITTNVLEYIRDKIPDGGNVKIWVTGFSRGAAVANLVGGRLNGHVEGGTFSGNWKADHSDIYTYTFATPQAVGDDYREYAGYDYGNIFNIVNPVDAVPKAVPAIWGFQRYGVTYYIPSYETSADYSNYVLDVVEKSELISGQNYVLVVSPTQGALLDDIMEVLGSILGSPEGDVALALQQGLYESFINTSDNTFTDIADVMQTCKDVWDIWSMGHIDNIAEGKFEKFAIKITKEVVELISSHTENDAEDSEELEEILEWIFERISAAHYPELYLAWMETITDADGYRPGKYRKLYVNCPVDISVYNDENVLVAQILRDEVQEIPNGVGSYIDKNGQKVITLPFDEEYTIRLVATNTGTVTYTISEENLNTGAVDRVISYQELPIVTGDAFNGFAGDQSVAMADRYKLKTENSSSVDPDIDQSGSSVEVLTVQVESEGNGTVEGGGRFVAGEFVQLKATAGQGDSFLHWEINGNVISYEPTYRMLVSEDITAVAVFTEKSVTSGGNGSYEQPVWEILVDGGVHGEIEVWPKAAKRDAVVTVTATPDDGYELDELTATDSKGNVLKLTDKGNGKYTFKMPAGRVEVEASFRKIVVAPVNPFVDISQSDYYYDAVLWAVENGVTNGTNAEGTLFSPDATVTRAQAMTFLWRAHGSPKATGTNPFTDVSTGDYYYDAVLWAVANGVTNGTSATTFSPNTAVTRAQAVTFQWRAAGSPAVSGSSFGDVAADAYYADAVTWAVAGGITNGTGGNTFSPDVVVSRAQAVTFLYRELTE